MALSMADNLMFSRARRSNSNNDVYLGALCYARNLWRAGFLKLMEERRGARLAKIKQSIPLSAGEA